ncbi:MAG: formate dehydrogenase subunit gamma [Streptosporangiales bacterium]|nr:formate dehydrogenase subunit gamma [Streptosporangiales bacterium]
MTADRSNESFDDRVRAVVAAHRGERGALLPVLHGIQDEFGHVDPAVVPILAEELNLSRADVHGVVTFYHDFRDRPPGQSTVRICRAEACQSVGAEALVAHARRSLGVELGDTTADGRVTVDQVFCLGNCALGPSVQVDGTMYGRVDAARFDSLVGKAVAP